MQEGFAPFVPPMNDLKQVVKTQHGGNCYIFETACKQLSREEAQKREQALLEAYGHYRDKLAICATKQAEKAKD